MKRPLAIARRLCEASQVQRRGGSHTSPCVEQTCYLYIVWEGKGGRTDEGEGEQKLT